MKTMKLAYDTNFIAEGSGYSKRKSAAFVEDCIEAASKRGFTVTTGYDDNRNRTYHFHHPLIAPTAFAPSKYVTYLDGKTISSVRLD